MPQWIAVFRRKKAHSGWAGMFYVEQWNQSGAGLRIMCVLYA